MTEPALDCSRCGAPIEESTASITIDRGPLRESDPVLHLCAHCSDSLVHWLNKRRRPPVLNVETAGVNIEMPPAPSSEDAPPRHRHHRSRRRSQKKSLRPLVVRTILLASFFLGFGIFIYFLLSALHSKAMSDGE